MAKGNYVAFQTLKETRLLVGDIYNKFVDNAISRRDAEIARKLKEAQERQKYIGERFKEVKIDSFATTSQLTDAAGKMYKDTYDFVADRRMMAERDPDNAMKYLAEAERAKSSYLSFSTALSSDNFIENANKKQEAISSGDYFLDSDEIERLDLYSKGQYMPVLENGEWTFYSPKNGKSQDGDPAYKKTTGEVISLLTEMPQKDQLKAFDKKIFDESKVFSDIYSRNYDGNRTVEKKEFVEKRANQWFDTTYGEFDANAIPVELQQYAKRTLKKEVETPEDYQALRASIVGKIASYNPKEETVETRKTSTEMAIDAQDLANKRLDGQLKRKALLEPPSGSRNGGVQDENGVVYGNTMLKLKTGANTTGYYNQGGISIRGSIGKGDGKKDVWVTAYWNPNGNNKKGAMAYGLSIPSNDGLGMTTVPLGSNGDRSGLTTARKYLSNSDFTKLVKETAIFGQNADLRRGGKYVPNPDKKYNVSFDDFINPNNSNSSQ